ncbi:hypothetical protein B0H34DRAFT_794023 [Crassisporium funariophilum]|nr:hypothetical protein B0H34DRAFT_794023 [Crassisporium funariophilum]
MPNLPDLLDLCVDRSGLALVPSLQILIIHYGDVEVLRSGEATLLALARSRFRSVDVIEMSNRKPLETFRIVFPYSINYPKICLATAAQAVLGHWASDLQPRSDQLFRLEFWRITLHRELPELDSPWDPRKRAFNKSFSKRMDRLIGAIEKYEMEDVKNIYVSRLHFSLRQLSQLRPDYIPGDSKRCFRERATGILEKWNVLILQDLAKRRLEWALKGKRSLIYIPKDDPLHTSPEALGMVYGLEDDMHEVDLSWSSCLGLILTANTSTHDHMYVVLKPREGIPAAK